MSDVIKIALQRRNELHAELKRLDDFIRMAESLVQDHGGTAPVSEPPAQSDTIVMKTPGEDVAEQPLRNASSRPTVFRHKAHG